MRLILISILIFAFNLSYANEADIGTYMCIDENIDISIADVAFTKMDDGSILGEITSVGKFASANIKSKLKQVDCDKLTNSPYSWSGGCFQGDGITFQTKHLDQLGHYRAFSAFITLPDGGEYLCKVRRVNTDLPGDWEEELL